MVVAELPDLLTSAEEPEAWPIPRDPRNPAEAELTEEDERAYMEEQLT